MNVASLSGVPFVLDPYLPNGEAVWMQEQVPRFIGVKGVLAQVQAVRRLHLSPSVYESLTMYLFVQDVFPSWLRYYGEGSSL